MDDDTHYILCICIIIGMKRDEDLKLREKALENLRIKGAFAAQELYDRHRGKVLYITAWLF